MLDYMLLQRGTALAVGSCLDRKDRLAMSFAGKIIEDMISVEPARSMTVDVVTGRPVLVHFHTLINADSAHNVAEGSATADRANGLLVG